MLIELLTAVAVVVGGCVRHLPSVAVAVAGRGVGVVVVDEGAEEFGG